MAKLEITYKNINDVTPYINNARTHPQAQIDKIKASISEFGMATPIGIHNNTIVYGHGRIEALKQLGETEVPTVDLSHLSEAQRKAYILQDNRTALDSGWDIEVLKLEMENLNELDFDLSLTGFDDDEIAEFLKEEIEPQSDEDAVPEVPAEPISKEGDIWILGNHRVMCGDSTSIDAVEKLMDGQLADQLITDPPYNVAYEGKTADALTIQNDSMSDEGFRIFLRDAFATADAVMKEGAVFYIWHADSEGYNFRGACHDVGWQVRQCLIWNKNSMVMGRQDYHWKHEPCLYGWKDGAGHLWNTDRKQVTILDFNRPTRNAEHPTMKPVDLIEYQVLNNTKGQDIVLDLFGGSGTTLIAAAKNGRNARLMELDPKYVDVIIKRWQDYTGKEAILESTGETFNKLSIFNPFSDDEQRANA